MVGIMTYMLALSFLGSMLMVQASTWGGGGLHNYISPESKLGDVDDAMKPIKSNTKVKDLNAKQQNMYYNIKPKMIEKTKILKRVRKLKDQGEERTKVIYRTRIIGMLDQKQEPSKTGKSDFNYFNLGDNIFEWPMESEEDEDYSDIMTSPKVKSDNEETKKTELKDVDPLKKSPSQNEMPQNNHSSKKELRNNLITSVEDTYNPRENRMNNLETIEMFDNRVKPTRSVFRKVNFDNVDEVDTKPKQTANAFNKFNFVDSLELYRNEQIKKQQLQEQLRQQQHQQQQQQQQQQQAQPQQQQQQQQAQPQQQQQQQTQTQQEQTLESKIDRPQRPKLTRQFSFYRYPNLENNNVNNNMNNIEKKADITATKPAIEPSSDTSNLQPPRISLNNIPLREQSNQNHYSSLDKTMKSTQQQGTENLNTAKPDWIGDLLMKKVVQAQAAQVKAAQQQLDSVQQQQKISP